jgi:hypothetical protein
MAPHKMPKTTARAESDESSARSTGQALSDMAADAAPADRKPGEDLVARREALLDEAIQETFPASDPIAPKRITR